MYDLEEWLEIPTHKRYEASTMGRFRIKAYLDPRGYKQSTKILKLRNRAGYKIVWIDGADRNAHRLVCETFHGKGGKVLFKDGDKANIYYDNLYYTEPASEPVFDTIDAPKGFVSASISKRFYELCRPQRRQTQRVCLKCQVEFYPVELRNDYRTCLNCRTVNARKSIRCTA